MDTKNSNKKVYATATIEGPIITGTAEYYSIETIDTEPPWLTRQQIEKCMAAPDYVTELEKVSKESILWTLTKEAERAGMSVEALYPCGLTEKQYWSVAGKIRRQKYYCHLTVNKCQPYFPDGKELTVMLTTDSDFSFGFQHRGHMFNVSVSFFDGGVADGSIDIFRRDASTDKLIPINLYKNDVPYLVTRFVNKTVKVWVVMCVIAVVGNDPLTTVTQTHDVITLITFLEGSSVSSTIIS